MKTNICHWAGCSTITTGYYCRKHQQIADVRNAERKKAHSKKIKRKASSPYHALYSSSGWRQLRNAFLKKYPVCLVCGAKATIADHIQPHRGDLSLFYNEDNLQPMCWACHSRKTLAENDYFKVSPRG